MVNLTRPAAMRRMGRPAFAAAVVLTSLTSLALSCDDSEMRCLVDFPCFYTKYICISSTEYRKAVTIPCEEFCSEPCSGGACKPTGPVMGCPLGTVCSKTRLDDPCAAPDAGAPDSRTVDAAPGADSKQSDAGPDAGPDAAGTGG